MYYYLYQITNKVNGKIYVGVHKTKSLSDGYVGSGKVIRRAIMKYGIENFTKDILEFFENAELMYAREKEIVNERFLLREDTYNIRRGGSGGFDYINSQKDIVQARNKKIANNRDYESAAIALRLVQQTQYYQYRKREGLERYYSTNPVSPWTGRRHSEKSKKLIGKANSCKMKGSGNSQFGTFWITNGNTNSKLKVGDLIPTGWSKGRTL